MIVGEGRILPADVPGRASVLQPARDRVCWWDGIAGAEHPVELGALADAVARHAPLALGAPDLSAERGELGSVGGREIRLDGFRGLDDVGVGVEDAVSGAGYRDLLRRPLTPSRRRT